MKVNVLILLLFISYFSSFANRNYNDSIFYTSFNLRYKNPDAGIALARELIKSKPQQAYLSLAYNYFFKSEYDSSDLYINKIIVAEKDDEIVYNLALSCKGWVVQRIGNDYEAYQYFDAAKIFYNKKKSKYLDNQLFIQGYVINELGLVTLKYYYLKDFDLISNQLKEIINTIAPYEKNVSNDLKFHIQYLFIQNYLNNRNVCPPIHKLNEHIKYCLMLADTASYYQAGNLFEIFGLYYKFKSIYNPNSNRIIDSLLNTCTSKNNFCSTIKRVISNNEKPELEFLKKSLLYFTLHGDPYQIAGANYYIAAYYTKVLTLDLKTSNQNNLDSLNLYITKALKFYQRRDSSYFNSIFKKLDIERVNISIDTFTSKLVSIPWFIKSLKLKNYYDGLYSTKAPLGDKIKSISFTTQLLELLENEYKSKTQGFYNAMEKANSEKLKAEQIQLRNLLVIIIFILVGVGLVIFFYKKNSRKEKEKYYTNLSAAKERLAEWNKILNGFLDINESLFSEKENTLLEVLRPLNEQIGKYFDVEYCAIGIVKENKLIDNATYFCNKLNNYQEDLLNKVKIIPIEKTIIGSFLNSGEDFVEFNEGDINKLENDYLKIYRKILASKRIDNIKLIGLYLTCDNIKSPLGYISFINVKTFDTDIKEKSIKLGQQLSRIFESEKNRIESENSQRIYLNKISDEEFVNSQLVKDNFIEGILKETCTYLAKEFNAGIISFRVPVLNGTDDEMEDNLLFPLRYLFVNESIKSKDKIIEFYYNEKKALHLSEMSHKNELIENSPNDIYINEKGQKNSFYAQFELESLFQSKTNIVLPIRKILKQSNEFGKSNAYWKNIYGIFNLQLFEIKDREEILERLKFLSLSITYVINGIIDKKKFQQMNTLNTEIKLLDYSQSDSFNNQIAKLIAKVINADICSIFMFNKINERLELKATTAIKARYNNEEVILKNIKYIEDIYFGLDEKSSVTVRAFIENKTYMIYSIDYYKVYSKKFMETMNTSNVADYSLLIVPLKNKTGNTFGVIKCLGIKISDENLIHSFWDFDRETIEFISTLASRFIENAQLDKEKDGFIMQVVHESLSPIAEMLHKSEEFFNRMNRSHNLPEEFTKYHQSLTKNLLLQKQILLDLNDAASDKSEIINLNLQFEHTYKILLDIVQLFEETAHFEKSISIQTNISKVPDLNMNKAKIEQVFINLLKNAINYSYNNSTIKIFYKNVVEKFKGFDNINWHEIKFENDGIGIPEREKDDIFLLYRRGSNAHLTKPSGSGIGLFLVAQIMKQHGGLCIIRKLNKPTEISILFPIKNK